MKLDLVKELEEEAEKKVSRRTRKRKPKMKVSGKGVFRLRKILAGKSGIDKKEKKR